MFVPVVALLALLTWLAWYLAGTASWYPASWLPQASNNGSLLPGALVLAGEVVFLTPCL